MSYLLSSIRSCYLLNAMHSTVLTYIPLSRKALSNNYHRIDAANSDEQPEEGFAIS